MGKQVAATKRVPAAQENESEGRVHTYDVPRVREGCAQDLKRVQRPLRILTGSFRRLSGLTHEVSGKIAWVHACISLHKIRLQIHGCQCSLLYFRAHSQLAHSQLAAGTSPHSTEVYSRNK